jgi:hypothetical protein
MIQTFFRFTYLINTGENIQLKLKWGFKHCLTVKRSEYWWPHQCFNFQSNNLVQSKWSKKFCNNKKKPIINYLSLLRPVCQTTGRFWFPHIFPNTNFLFLYAQFGMRKNLLLLLFKIFFRSLLNLSLKKFNIASHTLDIKLCFNFILFFLLPSPSCQILGILSRRLK